MPARLSLSTVLMLSCLLGALLPASAAAARPAHRIAKAHKTHRILAGSKSVRVNDAGEVITNQKP